MDSIRPEVKQFYSSQVFFHCFPFFALFYNVSRNLDILGDCCNAVIM